MRIVRELSEQQRKAQGEQIMLNEKIKIMAKRIMADKLNPEQIMRLNSFVFNSVFNKGEFSVRYRGKFDGYLGALVDLQIITEGEEIVLEEYFISRCKDMIRIVRGGNWGRMNIVEEANNE